MTLVKAAITGPITDPSTGRAGGLVKARVYPSSVDMTLTYPGGVIAGDNELKIAADGTVTFSNGDPVELATTDQAGILPAGVQWVLWIKGPTGKVQTFPFPLTADTTWDAVFQVTNTDVTPTLLDQALEAVSDAQDARDAALAAEAAAQAAQAAAQAVPTSNDTIIASRIDDTTPSATRAALDGAFVAQDGVGQVPPKALSRIGVHPGLISLAIGSEDEVWGVSNCTQGYDTTHYVFGGHGVRQTVSGAVTNANIVLNPVSPAAAGNVLALRPAQAVCALVWVDDPTKITNLQVQLYEDAAGVVKWTRATTSAPAQTLQVGWNLLRWTMSEGLGSWSATQIAQMKLYMTTSAATAVTWAHVYLETPPKARLIFVADRGYRSFVVNGLPDLRAVGVPVTWAIDVAKLGDHAGEYPNGAVPYADAITEAELPGFADAGDSISFHSYSGDPTSSMTLAQTRADALMAIKWLQTRGYRGRLWRAAWVQNTGPYHAAINDYVLAQATWDVTTHSVALDCWPPRDFQNIARWSFFDKSPGDSADCPTQFNILQRTNSLMVVYNHGVATGYHEDATQAQWDEFMTHVTGGIAAGWLEATTFEALFTESGGTFDTSLGAATVARYTRPDGTLIQKPIL